MSLIKSLKKIIFLGITILNGVIYKIIRVDENMYIYMSFLGRGYSCNTRYFYEYILTQDNEKKNKHIWVLKDDNVKIPGAKVIKYRGLKYFYYMAKSKYWIVNCKLPIYMKKKDNQVYVQLWHGTPLKKLGHDINIDKEATFYRSKQSRDEMVDEYTKDSAKYNYLISPNAHCSMKFETAFNVDKNKIVEIGYPRIDYIINNKCNKNKIKKELGIGEGKKVALYAPTWRDNNYNKKGYVFDLKVDFNKWKEELGEEWIVLFKPHYLIVNDFFYEGLNNDLTDFLKVYRENVDINDLYIISDLLITDYSSAFFDYSNLNRPILFYMYDLDEYKNDLRGFYLDIYKDLPGPIIESEEELLETIKQVDINEYEQKDIIKKFSEIYNVYGDGKASERLYKIIKGD